MIWTVRTDEGQVVPWLNGQGTTRELMRMPDTDEWQWRLSVATSTEAAEFSRYTQVERELLLLRGEALELQLADGRTMRLAPGQRTLFAGEDELVGVPIGGATEQLNLMWRRDSAKPVEVIDVVDEGAAFTVRVQSVDPG